MIPSCIQSSTCPRTGHFKCCAHVIANVYKLSKMRDIFPFCSAHFYCRASGCNLLGRKSRRSRFPFFFVPYYYCWQSQLSSIHFQSWGLGGVFILSGQVSFYGFPCHWRVSNLSLILANVWMGGMEQLAEWPKMGRFGDSLFVCLKRNCRTFELCRLELTSSLKRFDCLHMGCRHCLMKGKLS